MIPSSNSLGYSGMQLFCYFTGSCYYNSSYRRPAPTLYTWYVLISNRAGVHSILRFRGTARGMPTSRHFAGSATRKSNKVSTIRTVVEQTPGRQPAGEPEILQQYRMLF